MLFSQYSPKIVEIIERPLKHLLLLTSINWKCIKKQSFIIFELDNIRKQKRNSKNVKILFFILYIVKGLILASLKFKSELKEEELKAVVRRCSSK